MCHQHKGRESIQPALQAKGLEGRRGRVCRGGGWAGLLQTEFPIRVRKLWQSDYLLWLPAFPWTPAMRECHSCEGKVGCHWHVAIRVLQHNQKEQRCRSCKVTLGPGSGKEPWWMLTQNCSQPGGHLVPERSRKREEVKISTLQQLAFHRFLEADREFWVVTTNNILTLLSDFFFRFDLKYVLNSQSCYLNKHNAITQDTILSTKVLRRLWLENSQYLLCYSELQEDNAGWGKN